MVIQDGKEEDVQDLREVSVVDSAEPTAPPAEECVSGVGSPVNGTFHAFANDPVNVSSRGGRVVFSTSPPHSPPAADGSSGSNGNGGSGGSNGTIGRPGSNGGNGSDGSDGSHGGDGSAGRNGLRAGDLSLQLSGTAKTLFVRYNRATSVYQTRGLTACTDGGDGANGGAGGCGGHGGRGGPGGNGGDGYEGHGGRKAGAGGNGGNGGHGGSGGRGGRGGPGGNGGDAGNITIETPCPELLMLVDVSAKGGNAGRGGIGGERGNAGPGGRGGSRGEGGKNSGSHAADGKAPNGSSGKSGRDGQAGADGDNGADGIAGSDGHVSFTVTTPDGQSLVETASERYVATIESMEVSAVVDDGIFEPGEFLCVTGVRLRNTGGLTLPAGVVISLAGIRNFTPAPEKDSSYTVELSLPPGERFDIPFSFLGQIGPATGKTEFQMRTTLLSIGFGSDSYLTRAIEPVQYPVRLRGLERKYQAPSGMYTVPFAIENLSTFAYGGDGTGGHVEYEVTLEASALSLCASQAAGSSMESSLGGSESSRKGSLRLVAANDSHSEDILFQVEPSAAFYELLDFTVTLSLRGRVIETKKASIQVVPLFEPSQAEHASALFITNSSVKRDTFASFVNAFSRLSLSLCVWDSDLYNGVSIDRLTGVRHCNSWVDLFQGKLIVFLCKSCDGLGDLRAIDISSHFAPLADTSSDEMDLTAYDSSFVLLGPVPPPALLEHLGEASVLVKKLVHADFSDWFTFTKPSKKYMEEKCRSIRKEFELENPGVCFSVVGDYSPGLLKKTWTSHQITYGTAEVRRLAVTKVSKFHCSTLVQMGTDAERVLTMVIDALPLAHKLRLVSDISRGGAAGPVAEVDKALVERLIRASLFNQLKREFFLPGEELATLDQLVNLLHLERRRLLVPAVVELALVLVGSLKNATYWSSFKLLDVQRNKKHAMLDKYVSLIENIVTIASPGNVAQVASSSPTPDTMTPVSDISETSAIPMPSLYPSLSDFEIVQGGTAGFEDWSLAAARARVALVVADLDHWSASFTLPFAVDSST